MSWNTNCQGRLYISIYELRQSVFIFCCLKKLARIKVCILFRLLIATFTPSAHLHHHFPLFLKQLSFILLHAAAFLQMLYNGYWLAYNCRSTNSLCCADVSANWFFYIVKNIFQHKVNSSRRPVSTVLIRYRIDDVSY